MIVLALCLSTLVYFTSCDDVSSLLGGSGGSLGGGDLGEIPDNDGGDNGGSSKPGGDNNGENNGSDNKPGGGNVDDSGDNSDNGSGDSTLPFYTVTFLVEGVPYEIEPQTIEEGKKALRPEDPTREGYSFVGWYLGDTEWIFEENTVTENTEICAKWEFLYTPGLVFLLSSDKSYYTVTDYLSTESSVVIPDTYEGLPVKEIGNSAFMSRSHITEIRIPVGITRIGDSAFEYCDRIKSIIIPDGVTSIGAGAFSNCTSILSIVLPSGIKIIGENTFSECKSLESVVIPSGVSAIFDQAFAGCESLKDIRIPDGVKGIGEFVFMNCTSLSSIVIPSSVESIGFAIFYGCPDIKIYAEAEEKPADWVSAWNAYDSEDNYLDVTWGYKAGK